MTEYKAKWPDENGFINWSDEENTTWKKLYARQCKAVETRACNEFLDGLGEISMSAARVPQLGDINAALVKTGWSMIPVAGTIMVDEFFKLLSKRQFPVANFIRVPEEMDYLKQPDVFHELFGHAPLLMHQAYADFMQWYGETALTLNVKAQRIFSRLFWYTIEFGLMQTGATSDSGIKIYGGGILSSYAETHSCLSTDVAQHAIFDLQTVLQTNYDYQSIQQLYFVMDGWDALFKVRGNASLRDFLESSRKQDQSSFVNC